MPKVTRREAIVAGVASMVIGGASAMSAEPPERSELHDTMEGFRKTIPPDKRAFDAGTGMTVKGMEPYTLPHLVQVAHGLGVSTRKECLTLLTYLKDADLKVRYIAVEAIANATKAYPDGLSMEAITDTGSPLHTRMLLRFLDEIEKLPA
jgi:hypothetical protein